MPPASPSATANATAGAAAAPTQEAPLLGAGVEMQDMIDSIRATVQIATRHGVAHARIALQPEELGQLRIHLSQTGAGLLARVTADTDAAAQALVAGRAELHRSLNSLGTTLLRLDIGAFDQPQARDRSEGFTAARGASAENGPAATGEPEDGGDVAPIAAATAAPKGVLVDVLA
jgi:flagellar hook-length control protein FliK